jgi:GNAT superfamily N-acetyltransferase
MNSTRLTDRSDRYFKEAWALYMEAFPKEERRTLARQTEIMKAPYYNFEIFVQEARFVGFLLWWEFKNLRFIDHLATLPRQRGKGHGTGIMKQFLSRDTHPVILEVELPEDVLKQRRIHFYENLGFKLNLHSYLQPPLQAGCDALALRLMSYPVKITEASAAAFVKNYHPMIYE